MSARDFVHGGFPYKAKVGLHEHPCLEEKQRSGERKCLQEISFTVVFRMKPGWGCINTHVLKKGKVWVNETTGKTVSARDFVHRGYKQNIEELAQQFLLGFLQLTFSEFLQLHKNQTKHHKAKPLGIVPNSATVRYRRIIRFLVATP